jgi:nitrogenase molybdenum-iron protein alpha chain
MVNTKIWKFVTPPWEKEPQLTASMVHPSRVNGARKNGESKSWRKPAAVAEEPM